MNEKLLAARVIGELVPAPTSIPQAEKMLEAMDRLARDLYLAGVDCYPDLQGPEGWEQ
jgi:hypothetical protein